MTGNEKAFKNALINECGFNATTASFIQEQGFKECSSFKSWHMKEFDEMVKTLTTMKLPVIMDKTDKANPKEADEQISIGLMSVRELKIFFVWTNCMALVGIVPDATKY